tara:strand:+ start:2157 stop:3257 length:1101 start_codon:yes stop_codon:yes gene_type:complete
MKKKKLIIFMPAIEGGGVEKNLFIISNFLAKKISNITLINASRRFNNKFKNINIINPYFKFWDKMGRKGRYFICLIHLIKIFLKDNNCVVFAFQANLYCILICRIFKIKVITRSNSSPSGWSKNFVKTFIFEKLLKLSNLIIVNSYEFKKELKRKFNVKSVCIYNPLNKKEILKKSKEKINIKFFGKKSLNIINVARFADQKDQITLLEALNMYKKKLNFKLVLVGRGALKNKLLDFIQINNLKNKIKLIDFQNNPFKFIKKSDLFILSSKFEGLPNVILEAMVLKKFVISSDCPTGPKEILLNGKGGFLFKTGSAKDLGEKIMFYAKNKKKLRPKIIFSYKNLNRFDYNKNLNKYYSLINDKLIN